MNTEAIKLLEILPIDNPDSYKLHLAARSAEDGSHPLDVYLYDRNDWIAWNEWRGKRNDWNRQFIFTLIEYAPVANAFLFGGVFEVNERRADHYVLSEVQSFAKWEGRLICKFHRYQGLRGRAFKLESFVDGFELLQVLPQRYDGEQFCGHEWVNHAFTTLAPLHANQKQDWKASLSALKGVYLITDNATGRVYVGSAYGGEAIWSRLGAYLATGHGGNAGLIELISKKGHDYAMANFSFSILEVFPFSAQDSVVIEREAHWKRVLQSRTYGYNRN